MTSDVPLIDDEKRSDDSVERGVRQRRRQSRLQRAKERFGGRADASVRERRRTVALSVLELTGALGGAYALEWSTQLPICNLFFACGCRAPWNGGIDQCNVFNSSGPRCPWCTLRAGWTVVYLPIAVTFAVYVTVASQRPRADAWHAALAAVAAFLLFDLLLGVTIWYVSIRCLVDSVALLNANGVFSRVPAPAPRRLASDYPYFLSFGPTPPHREQDL